ncbi:DNA (cytosine-5-)-methyltransferase [Canibacter sp. lx-72]|nr:DNA (cytosine-5-)-methyltransferase [Canibacter zhuwentaonis]MBT1018018.1 DNA (cytosine-5-)-methyltransferase [Canibacter zhuwentaonis]
MGFVLENVEGLVTHDKGNTFKVITQTLLDLGYSISHSILDGKDFGLAQSRKRIYIIGFRSKNIEQLENFEFTHSVLEDVIDSNTPPVESEFSKKLLSKYKLKDVYGKAIKDKRGGKNNIHSWDIGLKGDITEEQVALLDSLLKQRRNKKWAEIIGIQWMDGMPLTLDMIATFFDSPKLAEMLDDLVSKGYLSFEYPKKLVGNKRVSDKTLEKGYNITTGKLSFEFTKILSPYETTPTLVATDVRKLAVPVSNGIRPLTVKEGLRLFGFPDNYELSFLKENEAFDLLGNTVCVPVIKAVSSKLLKTYKENRGV